MMSNWKIWAERWLQLSLFSHAVTAVIITGWLLSERPTKDKCNPNITFKELEARNGELQFNVTTQYVYSQ